MMPTQFDKTKWLLTRVRDLDSENEYVVHSDARIKTHISPVDSLKSTSMIRMKGNDSSPDSFLMHYGVKGQKWGVITKEYEPVAVDHRKNRGFNPIGTIRSRIAERNARERAELQKIHEDRMARIEARKKRMQIAGTVLGVGILAASLYAGYRLNVVKRNRAYAGILSRFLKKNPFSAGNVSQILSRGHDLAKDHIGDEGQIRRAISNLKKSGEYIRGRRADRIYRAGRFIERSNKIKIRGPAFLRKLNAYRQARLRSRAFDRIYF